MSLGVIKITYYSLSSALRNKLGMTDNTLTIDLPHSFNVQIKKGIIDMTLPTEGGVSPDDVQSGGSLIMSMGGTSRHINIRFTVKGDTHDDFVREFNRIYSFFSVMSIGDVVGLTVEALRVSDSSDDFNYNLWHNVDCVFQGATFSYNDQSPNSATITIELLIGEVI